MKPNEAKLRLNEAVQGQTKVKGVQTKATKLNQGNWGQTKATATEAEPRQSWDQNKAKIRP